MRALVSHGRFLPMAQVAILKYSIKCRKDLDWCLLQAKASTVSLCYYLATDNIHIVLENDNTVLIKDLKRL